MSHNENSKRCDLEERTFEFAKTSGAFVKQLPRTISNIEDVKQFIRASGSIGATYIEANEAIGNLTGESRDKTYDAFSLLFLMSKSGEVNPLLRAIEEHPSTEARLAVVKLLALSGQAEVLPAFRRMAVRGSLPPEVRSAVMEAIYQVTSQSGETEPTA